MKCDNCNHQKDGACSNHCSPYSGLKTDFDWGCAFFAPRPDTAEVRVLFQTDKSGIQVDVSILTGSNETLNRGARSVMEALGCMMAGADGGDLK